jgi:hypothetical protein
VQQSATERLIELRQQSRKREHQQSGWQGKCDKSRNAARPPCSQQTHRKPDLTTRRSWQELRNRK